MDEFESEVDKMLSFLVKEIVRQKLSIAIISRRSGISPSHLNRIMNQETTLTFPALERLSSALGLVPLITFVKK